MSRIIMIITPIYILESDSNSAGPAAGRVKVQRLLAFGNLLLNVVQ